MNHYAPYRQLYNGNYEPIEADSPTFCHDCGEEVMSDQRLFERGNRLLCAECYLKALFKDEAMFSWYGTAEEVAKAVADAMGDTCGYAEEIF